MNVGESCKVRLCDGTSAAVKLLDLKETRDDLRQAVREARVTVEVNGRRATLTAANYRLPIDVGGVQIDCAVTRGCVRADQNPWALERDARLRLWPAGSPWIRPGTFAYPVPQRWFASDTQMANEPCYVNACDLPAAKSVYYHWGLDIGGAEALVDVTAATDGVVISAGEETIKPADFPPPVKPRHDVVYLRDGRGWYYRYSHLSSIDLALKPGARIHLGQKIGVLGKEGASGGWSHLHFEVVGLQPSGRFGVLEGYALLWQACHAQRLTLLQAVARPHRIAWTGDNVLLNGRLSWSAKGPKHIAGYQWLLSDGSKLDGPTVTCRYARGGEYSEILKVTDADGRVDYDFAVVVVFDRGHPDQLPPAIHAAYWPTFDLKAGDEVTFKVRSFCIGRSEGCERWNFGDGSRTVESRSRPVEPSPGGGESQQLAKDGYAVTKHRYAKPGHYLVSVSRVNKRGETATARLHIGIGP